MKPEAAQKNQVIEKKIIVERFFLKLTLSLIAIIGSTGPSPDTM
jgi:hypothetical protein